MPNNYEIVDNLYNSFFAYKLGKDMNKDNLDDKFKIGERELSKSGTLLGGVSLLGSLASWNENRQRQNIVNNIRQDSYDNAYVNVPTDNRYNPGIVDMFNNSSFKDGGQIPDRYKEMGFTRVGQSKKSTRDGKKWMILAKKGDKYKVVHGGAVGMEDYTQHQDKERRERFWDRMGGRDSAKANDPFSPLYWHKRKGTWKEGGLVSEYGYRDNSPYKNEPYIDIDSNVISMLGVSKPLIAYPNNDEPTIMYPNKEYYFPNSNTVREVPIYQKGGYFNPYKYGSLQDFTNQELINKAVRFNKVFDESGNPNIRFENRIDGRSRYNQDDKTIYLNKPNDLLTELPHAYQDANFLYDNRTYSDSNEIPLNNATNQFNPDPFKNVDVNRRERDLDRMEQLWEEDKFTPNNKRKGLIFLPKRLVRDKILDSWLYDMEGTAEYEAHQQIEPLMRSYVENEKFEKGGIYINPENRGVFTKKADRNNMSVQQYANYVLSHKDDFSVKTRRQAQFVKNAKKFKHQDGGEQQSEYEDWQIGYEQQTPQQANSIEDYMRDNPDDYEIYEAYGKLFTDEPEIIVDPEIQYWEMQQQEYNNQQEQQRYEQQFQPKQGYQSILNNPNKPNSIYPVVEYLQQLGYKPSSVDSGKHNVGSKHGKGLAVDLGINTTFGGDSKKMQNFLDNEYPRLKQMYPNLKLIDERNHPKGQKVWSGSHYHLEIN